MVVERLISIKEAARNPIWVFVIGGVISVISLVISFLAFQQSVGLFTTVFITIAILPFMLNLNIYEEAKEEYVLEREKEVGFFKRHSEIIKIYVAFFSGMILALSIIFIMLPEKIVEKVFQDQINTINFIRGDFLFGSTFLKIFANNTGVLFLSFLFSLIYGAGAIFILAWNASILATAIGITAKTIGGFISLPVAIINFLPHGIPEIMAYFLAAIAGGSLSAAITRKKSHHIALMLKDSSQLIVVSMIFLMVGALIETLRILKLF